MRVTVCELNDEPRAFERDWKELARHVGGEGSELVLLPEMPFSPWLFWRKKMGASLWMAAVKAHEEGLARLGELSPAAVLGSRPVGQKGKRLNEGFIWTSDTGYQAVHEKFHLPDEPGFWEASWYDRGSGRFKAFTVPREKTAGYLICSELWFFEHARKYGKAKVQMIVCPRATPKLTVDKWLAGGRAAAVVSGAFCLSSNRLSAAGSRADLGGLGWIIGPDGEVLGLTTPRQPFVTLDLDLALADRAKQSYPRYLKD